EWQYLHGDRWMRTTDPEGHRKSGRKVRALYAAPQPAEPRLNAPAQVGHTRFGYGVPWSTVIGAAQRYHAIENSPTKEQERMKKAAERLKARQPAEPVKGQTGKTVLQSNQSLNEPVKVPSDDLAHEIWAAAQTAPGEGIEDAVERVAALLTR